ncbi:MAG: hypothetical protein II649_00490 [Kiritimatiellae bacterium]|nr:hypothetical protein [Kiritimatiellia bacterium]
MTQRERNLVRRSEKFAKANECVHDKTLQRRFELRFLSLDCPDANGDMRDYGDCGRAARRLFASLDEPFRRHVRELRFREALRKLERHPELQKTLVAIRRFRQRQKIFSALKIKANVYRERFSQLTKLLEILT